MDRLGLPADLPLERSEPRMGQVSIPGSPGAGGVTGTQAHARG